MSSLQSITLVLTFFLFSQSFAQSLTFAAENSAPPYSDSLGKGISFNIINAVFEGSQYDIKYVSVPYARALKMLTNDKVDGVFNVTPNVENSDLFVLGKEPLFEVNCYFYYSKKSKLNFRSFADVPDNTSIGVMIGFEYGEAFDQNKHRFDLVQVANQKQLVNLLIIDRISLALMYERVANHTLATLFNGNDLITKGQLQSSSDVYLAFNKERKDIDQVIAFFDQNLKLIKETEQYLTLLKH